MTTTFRQSLAAATQMPASLRLPLCHVADFGTILSFIEAGQITTHEVCDVFKMKLNYFFYGRAAYRPKDGSKSHVAVANPAALILAPHAVPDPHTVYPFDTGGYPRYATSTAGHALRDFALDLEVAECERVIERHWNTHEDYIRADLSGFREQFDPDCPAVECYSAIVRDTDPDLADDRRSSLEVTSLIDVPIDASNIIGVVLPRKYAANSSIQALKAAGTVVTPYLYSQQQRTALMSVTIEHACTIVGEYLA